MIDTQWDRETLKCWSCGLVQFMTRNELCRKCGVDLRPKPVPVPEPEIVPVAAVEDAEAVEDGVARFARGLRNLREAKGLTQRGLARRMKCPRTYISKVENGKAMPLVAQLRRFSLALGVSLAELLDGQGEAQLLLRDPFLAEVLRLICPLEQADRDLLLTIVRSFVAHRNEIPTPPREAA